MRLKCPIIHISFLNSYSVRIHPFLIKIANELSEFRNYLFDISLPTDVPVCAILVRINEYDTLSGEKYQPKQLHSFSTYLANLLETVFPNTKDCLICSSFENEIAVICTLEDKKTAHDMGRKIEELFEAEKKHIESIAIGSMEVSLYKIHASCANARRALALGLWSDGLLISYEDILLHSSESAKYPYDLEADLISALKNRNPQEADQCLKNMLHFILPQTKNDKISRTYLLAQLYGALIKYARESGLTGGFAEEPSHYAELLSLSGEGILLWFHGLMENILAQIAYRKANSEQLLSGRIKKYLEKNYQKDISIPELSEIFLYSPTHLSRIFHSETGSSIKQYLTKIRMEKACELLGDYSLKISEAGELTGYPRVHGFLKQFKNFTGQTPSEYREYLSAKKTKQRPKEPDAPT